LRSSSNRNGNVVNGDALISHKIILPSLWRKTASTIPTPPIDFTVIKSSKIIVTNQDKKRELNKKWIAPK
jgi:hypothetical protein